MELENKLITAETISEVLGVSKTYAYAIIKKLNKELEDMGYLTISGKVEGTYFLRRFFPSINTAEPVNK